MFIYFLSRLSNFFSVPFPSSNALFLFICLPVYLSLSLFIYFSLFRVFFSFHFHSSYYFLLLSVYLFICMFFYHVVVCLLFFSVPPYIPILSFLSFICYSVRVCVYLYSQTLLSLPSFIPLFFSFFSLCHSLCQVSKSLYSYLFICLSQFLSFLSIILHSLMLPFLCFPSPPVSLLYAVIIFRPPSRLTIISRFSFLSTHVHRLIPIIIL